MKQIRKSGITIVTLVITVIILVLLTGAVMLTMNSSDIFGQTKNTVDEHNKQAIIEQINLEIETEMIKNVNEIGRYQELSKEETINIIEKYGTYEEDTLKLTTREKNIPIYLYEILDIKAEEYVTAVYRDKQLTITEKESLSSNGYKYEYTFDNGLRWQTYTSPITIQEQSGIKVRLINSEGKVISNEYVVTKGAGEETVNKIKAITVTNPPTKTTYVQGETFNSLGMQITVTYEDNTSKVVTNYNYTPTRALTVSDKYVTISYTENGVTKQATQSITVTNNIASIAVTTPPNKTLYKDNDTFDKTGMVVTATYQDKTTRVLEENEYTVSTPTYGQNYVTITHTETGITTTQSVTIDNSKPTVTIASNKTSPTNANVIIYTITFSEDVTGFTKEDLTLSNIGTSTFAGSGKEYTLTVLTSENQDNTQSVSVAAGKCTDSVGNTNQASNTLSIAIDRVAPNNFTPTITSITDTTITVQGSTTDNNGQAITYYYSNDNGTTWVPQNGTTNTTYTFANLTSGGEYNIKMKAVDTLNNAGTTTAIATNTYVQLKNYLMLYDRGDECVDVTGGWELYGSNVGTFSKNADSLSISYSMGANYTKYYVISGAVNPINLSNYKNLISITAATSYICDGTTGIYYAYAQWGLRSSLSTTYYTFSNGGIGVCDILLVGDSVEYAVPNELICYSTALDSISTLSNVYITYGMTKYQVRYGHSATTYLYDLFAVKEDNWQKWCEKGGIDVSDYADLDALIADTNAINTLLNSKKAVEYMIYNCTGTVMAKCMQSSDILTMIANSQYNELITGNTHWNKFIQKFSS